MSEMGTAHPIRIAGAALNDAGLLGGFVLITVF